MEISCVKNGEEEVSTAPEETRVFDNAKSSCDEDKQVEQISNSAQALEENPYSAVKVSCDEEMPHVCEGNAILEKEKEEEHQHHVPKKQRICARNCSVDLQLQEAAEMVLILSGMGQMRAGRPPTEFERDLMAKARQKLGSLVEKHLLPRDLVSKESVEIMIEDLGLNRLRDHTKLSAPLKSIAERAADAINKLEQARLPAMSTAMVSTSLAKVEHGPVKIAVGGTPVALPAQRVQAGPLKHLVPSSQPLPVMQPFMPVIPVIAKTSVTQPVPPELKTSVVTSSPFLPNAMIAPASTITPQAQVSHMAPVAPLAPILRAENQVEMRSVVVSQPATTLMPSTQMPGQMLKSLSVPVIISEKKSAPSSAEMMMTVGRDHSKGFSISASNVPQLVQMTSLSTANVDKDNIGKDIDLSVKAPRKVEGNRDFNEFNTTSVQFEQKDLKGVSMPAASSNVHTKQIPHQPVESLTTRATHSDIARNVQKILQSKPADLRQWELPSKAYMNAPVTCQVCKITVTDIDNILVCDSCEKAVHIKCLQAYNQRGAPKVGDWHCPKCLVASNGRQLPPKYGRVGKSSVVRRTTAISNKSNPQAAHAKKIETSQLKSRQHTVVSNGMNTTPEIPIHVDLTHANNRHVSQETGDASGDHKRNSEMHLIQSVKEGVDGSNEPVKKELSEEAFSRFAGGTLPENENHSSPTNAVTQFPNQQSANMTVSLLDTHNGVRDPQLNLQLNTNSIKQSQTLSNSHGADRLRIQQAVSASEDLFQNTSIQRLPSESNEMSGSQLSEGQTSKDGGGDPRPASEDAQHRTLHQSSIVDAKSSNEGTDQGRVTEEEDAYRVEWVGDKLEVSGGKTYYQSCRVKGVLYKLNDYALFRPETPNVPPYIAKLQVLWEDDDTRSKWVRVNWCYYPNDIPQEVPRPTTPEKDEIITDAAPVCKRAGKLIEGTYRHIFWTPCCVHALNNALKDIGKIDWVKNVVAEARDLQMFICNHHTSLALFRSFSKKEFLKPADTRYATYFILLQRMIEVQEALQSMVVCVEWKRWPESQTQEGKRLRDKVLDENWWTEARYIVSFISPVFEVIRYADTDSPNLGEIYETFDSMLGEMKRIINAKDPSFYEGHIRPIIEKRWNKMNTPLHMAAHVLNPKWYAPKIGKMAPNDDVELKDGFMNFLAKMFSREDGRIVREEFVKFVRLKGPRFSRQECKEDRATIAQTDPIGWWELYGDDAPHLKHLAIRLLSQVGSSSAAERNWSTYGFIHSLRRNRLTSRRAEKLVAVHSSLRLSERVTPEYRASPAARWDIDPVEAGQLEADDDEADESMFGLPLHTLHLDDESISSDSSTDEEDMDAQPLAHEPIDP